MSLWLGSGGTDARNRSRCFFTERAWPARLVESSADFKQTRVALIAPAWSTATLRSAAQLLLADEGERGAKLFVLDDRPLVDLLDLVEGAVGEVDPTVADRQAAVGIVHHGEPLADRRLRLLLPDVTLE